MRQVLNDVEASEFLGLSPGTLRNWRVTRKKGPPFIKLHGRIVYKIKDLMNYLEKNTITPVA